MATTRPARKPSQTSYPKRGEIYLTALDPTIGSEIQKTRPALVIQNDVGNRVSSTTIVAPISSTVRFPLSPVHVLLIAGKPSGLSVDSVALVNQIRTVDRARLIKRLGTVDASTMRQVEEAILLSLGINVI